MMTIDMTAMMAPVMWGVAAALLASMAGIVLAIDRSELPHLGLRAMRDRLSGRMRTSPRPSVPAVVSGF